MTGTAPPVVPLRDVLRGAEGVTETVFVTPGGGADPWMGARLVAFRGRRVFMTRGQQARLRLVYGFSRGCFLQVAEAARNGPAPGTLPPGAGPAAR